MKSLLLTLLTFLITFTYVFADTSIRVSAVGDLMLTQSKVVKGIKEHGYKYPFDNVKIYFSSSDISIANLEFPISKRGIPVNKKWTFRANPSILKSLAYSGINVFGIANNHACDYGTNAFLDTIDYLKKSSFSVVGGGTDIKDARQGIVIDKKGIKTGFVALGCILPKSFYSTNSKPGILSGTPENIVKSIKTIKDKSDIVVVFFHWGGELRYYPKDYQRDYAKLAIRNGADIVIGHHPHVVQGVEFYNGKPIFYSLGNFVSSSARPETKESVILDFEVVKSSKNRSASIKNLSLKPITIDNGQPKTASKQEAEDIFKLLKNISYDFKTFLEYDDTNTKINISTTSYMQPDLTGDSELIIDKNKLILKVVNSSGTVIARYPVSAGKKHGNKKSQNDKRTPEGTFKVIRIQKSIDWKYNFKDGKGFVRESYGPWYFATSSPFKDTGICGAISERLIGKRNTRGFIRLKNRDLIDLKNYVKVGTKITVLAD